MLSGFRFQGHYFNDTVSAGYINGPSSYDTYLDEPTTLPIYGIDTRGDLVPEVLFSVSQVNVTDEVSGYQFAPVGWADGTPWTAPLETSTLYSAPDRAVDSFCGTDLVVEKIKPKSLMYEKITGVLKFRGNEFPVEWYQAPGIFLGNFKDNWQPTNGWEMSFALDYSLSESYLEFFAGGTALNSANYADVSRQRSGYVHLLTIGALINSTYQSPLIHVMPMQGLPIYGTYPETYMGYDIDSDSACIVMTDGNRVGQANTYLKSLRTTLRAGGTANLLTLESALNSLIETPTSSVTYGVSQAAYVAISSGDLALTDFPAWRSAKYVEFSTWAKTILKPVVMLAAEGINTGTLSESELDEMFEPVVLSSAEILHNDLLEEASLPLFVQTRKSLIFAT